MDTETSGVSVLDDHIVTLFLGLMDDTGYFHLQQDWLIDFGGEIPQGATDVHGISTSHMREHGRMDVARVLEEVYSIIEAECGQNGAPLVAYNASFDLSLLETERRRHAQHIPPLDFTRIHVYDPFVADKRLNKWRKGKRTLTAIAPEYGVPVEENAHDAGADCLMTGRIALRQLKDDLFRGIPLPIIAESIALWAVDQRVELQEYFRGPKGGQPDAVVDMGFPLHSALTVAP